MAQLTITIPDDKVTELTDAFANRFGWDSESGLTKNQFFRQVVIDYIKNQYQLQVAQEQADAAYAASLATTSSTILT